MTYSRRVYKDETKPLDVILDIRPYERNSLKVQEMGSVWQHRAHTPHGAHVPRMAADSLSYILKTAISPSSKTGQRIHKQEEALQSEEPGKIKAAVLMGESDGVEKERKKEVKVAVLYTGKQPIRKDRYRVENKVVMSREWQIKLRELADRTYQLEHTQLLVVGGDGNSWVRQSFDLLNLPQTHLLDRFHVMPSGYVVPFGYVVRALRQAFGRDLKASDLKKRLFNSI